MNYQVDQQTLPLKQLESINTIAWIMQNEIKTERGTPITFDSHSFMIDPYLDWTPLQGVRKAAQCGWSVMTNLKLFFAGKFGIPGYDIPAANVIYTLPADKDVSDFVPSKTDLLIANNPVIQEYLRNERGVTDFESMSRKRMGNSMLYFKGTRSKSAALMITSDLNIHDESDRSDQSAIGQYESRLTYSAYKGRWIFSNPSVPNMPADLMFLQSDQKHWFIQCVSCNHWQYLDWYKLDEHDFIKSNHAYIDPVTKTFVCSGCGRPIRDENKKWGRWIRKYQNKAASGYWVSQLMYPWMSAADLLTIEADPGKTKSYFMNFVLGIPYVGSDTIVDGQVIVNNIVLDEVRWTRGKVAMGIDNGDTKHYVIGDERGIFEVGKTRSWDDIETLIRKYDPFTVIDLNPYPNKPRELASKYPRVYCSFYIEESKNYELIDWGERDKKYMVYPVRNALFDDLVAYISEGRMKFYRAKAYWEEFIAHWETMYRGDMIGSKRAEDVGPSIKQSRGVWQSSTGNDHFAHATLYYYVALSRLIGGGGKVLRSEGDPVRDSIREAGNKIAPAPVITERPDGTYEIDHGKSFIPDMSTYGRKKQGKASTSGNV